MEPIPKTLENGSIMDCRWRATLAEWLRRYVKAVMGVIPRGFEPHRLHVSDPMTKPVGCGGLDDPAAFVRGLAAPEDLTRGLRRLGRVLEGGPPPACASVRACPSLLAALDQAFPRLNADGREALVFVLGLLLQVATPTPAAPVSSPIPVPASGKMLSMLFAEAHRYLLAAADQESRCGRVALLVVERLVTSHACFCDVSDLPIDQVTMDLLSTVASTSALSSSVIRRLVESCCTILGVSTLYSRVSFPAGKEIGIPYVPGFDMQGKEDINHLGAAGTDSLVSLLNGRLNVNSTMEAGPLIDTEAVDYLLECRDFLEQVVRQSSGCLGLASYDSFQTLLSLLDIIRLSTEHLTDAISRKEYTEAGCMGVCIFLLQHAIRMQPNRSGQFGFTGFIIKDQEKHIEELLNEGARFNISVSCDDIVSHGIFWPGYRSGLLTIIAQLLASCPASQETLRILDGLPSIVIHCSGDFGCPGAREWALYAIKLATDFNVMNRAALSKLVTNF